MYEKSEEDKVLSGISPYIKFLEDTLVDNLVLQLQEQTKQEQLLSIQNFTVQQHKFFSASQILKILVVLFSDKHDPPPNQVRNHAIIAMKPYISPLSTDQAQQIISIIPWADGVGSGIIVSQIYDLYNNIQNQEKFNYTIQQYYPQLYRYYSSLQFSKNFITNFLITSEGLNVAFIIDQSSTMGAFAFNQEDGTIVTRYQLLKQFYFQNVFDILESFTSLSYKFMGNFTDQICDPCPISRLGYVRTMSVLVDRLLYTGGDSNIYQSLEYFLTNPFNQITDIYLLSDGISTEGTIYINDFIKLVEETNSHRRSKIRINTVSFLIGGNEPLIVKENANNLLQTLADITGGTFIQAYP
ncbi:hypothetical protein ABPG74_012308 [Tetrahymena malaccensis]